MTESVCRVLIIGGGVAGLNAARVLNTFGAEAHLVEKTGRLGGHAAKWACMATDVCRNCGACLCAEWVEQARRSPLTNVWLETSVGEIVRDGAGFKATLVGKEQRTLSVDAVIVAAGMQVFDPSRIESLEYAHDERIVTTADLNRILGEENLERVLHHVAAPAIAFVQCVGSRNRELNRDYCSQVCCKTAVRQAQKILHLKPDARISIFNIDLQIIGKEFRSQIADLKDKVALMQGVPGRILTGREEGKLTVIREDAESGARMAHHFDLIVLAVGMGPPTGLDSLMTQTGLETDKWGFIHSGKEESARHVYAAGTAQGPMDILSAGQQGAIAAHQIVRDFGLAPAQAKKAGIAVIGLGQESLKTAGYLAGEGFPVSLLRLDGESDPDGDKRVCSFPGCRLASVDGVAGEYSIRFVSDDKERFVDVAAIVVAAEARHLKNETDRDGLLSDLTQLKSQWNADKEKIPARLVFWLDRQGPEWKTNARDALGLALDMAQNGRRVSMIMENMPVHGLEGQALYDQSRREGVRFFRSANAAGIRVSRNDGHLTILMADATLPGIEIELECDLLVLPEKIVPAAETPGLAHLLKQPMDKEGFMQPANVRHRPVSGPRRGIFFVGTSHDENDAADFTRELHAIAGAIDGLACDRPTDELRPVIHEGKCARCLTCFRVCPHAAITIRNRRQPVISPGACFGCGLCVSSCPAQAIADARHGEEAAGSAVSGTYVFACERSAALAGEQAGFKQGSNPGNIYVERIPCAGRLSVKQILTPLLNGADRVLVAACHQGNCRSMDGGVYATARVDRLLTDIGLDASTVGYHAVAANEPAKFKRILHAPDLQGKGGPQ